MSGTKFIQALGPIAGLVFIVGWTLAVVAYFAVGNETCTDTNLGIAGKVTTCTDTKAVSIIVFMMVGFGATLGALFLWALRFVLASLDSIAENTRRG